MESLGILAGGVAHDLNNVLSGIINYPELILLNLPEDSTLRKSVIAIKDSGLKAAAIVQDLLTMARGVAVSMQPVNLNKVILGYLRSPECKKLLQYHPQVTICEILDSELFHIMGSPVHVGKVVMNLVSNAAEAIGGEGTISISTENCYLHTPLKGYDDVTPGEYAVLRVSDTGPGIHPEDLHRIFEPFYTKKQMGRSGTGLGLTLVWNVMRDHDGYIDVQSSAKGTTFKMYFPISRELSCEKSAVVRHEDLQGNGETVMVVDDVKSQREIFCSMLEVFKYNPVAVAGGEAAIEYLKTHKVDLLLLDMMMDPGINGCETYRRIIADQPSQKAIIVSGYAETDQVKEAQRLGAGRYLKKPVVMEELGKALKEALLGDKNQL
jgi:two-component system cell cycle sensor histidine kinase/response regulator CckA